jgi:uncharacterized membrane protein YecN with MAPEG domain
MITPIFAAFAACFLVYLSYRVIKIRKAHSVSVGTAGDPALERAVRNHGNFIEYAPLTLLMLAMVEYIGLAAWAVWVLGIMFVASRLIHFAGFRSKEAPGVFRVVGMALTFTTLISLAVISVSQFLVS